MIGYNCDTQYSTYILTGVRQGGILSPIRLLSTLIHW